MTSNISKTHLFPSKENWVQIQEFKKFPILPSTRKSFQQLLHRASLSFDGLAKVAEQDPAICLHMLLHIKDQTPDSLGKINTAAGCISLLGMENVVKLVKSLPVLDAYPKKRSERNYMNTLHSAVLAGRLASRWSQFKPGLNQHQAQWAAMLASAPLWAWQLQQVSASQDTLNHLSEGKGIISALELSFGEFTPKHFSAWKNLAHDLALPDICQQLWQENKWPTVAEWKVLRKQPLTHIENNRELKIKCQQPEMLIFFANALATQYRIGAYRTKAKRWLELSAHYLNKSSTHLHKELIDLSLQLAQQGRLTTIVNSLLAPRNSAVPTSPIYECIPSKSSTESNKPLSVETPEPSQPLAPEQRQMDQGSIRALIQQLQDFPESFGDWHTLMQSVLKSIVEGIGLKHAYIMVQNKLGTSAKVYYQQGLSDLDPLCRLEISLERNSIFKKLLEKPASIMITPDNKDKMLRGIAPAQKAMFPQQFIMMSLFSNDRPVGIVFAGIEDAEMGTAIQPIEYKAFKSLCLAASASLGKLAAATKSK